MSDIRDFFIKTLDDSSTGIQAMMVRLRTRISEVDPEVEKLLARQGIKMQYFAFRWVRLVFLMKSEIFMLPRPVFRRPIIDPFRALLMPLRYSEKQEMPPEGVFGCLELRLFGIKRAGVSNI